MPSRPLFKMQDLAEGRRGVVGKLFCNPVERSVGFA